MTSVATLQPDPAPIIACTVSRDVQNFEILIDDMEQELNEAWGDLGFEDALVFLDQPEAAALEFIAIAVDADDEGDLAFIIQLVGLRRANEWLVVARERRGEADEQGRVGRRLLPILVFFIAIWKVDTNADDFSG